MRAKALKAIRTVYPGINAGDAMRVQWVGVILGRRVIGCVRSHDPEGAATVTVWAGQVKAFPRCKFCDSEKQPVKGSRCPDRSCAEWLDENGDGRPGFRCDPEDLKSQNDAGAGHSPGNGRPPAAPAPASTEVNPWAGVLGSALVPTPTRGRSQ